MIRQQSSIMAKMPKLIAAGVLIVLPLLYMFSPFSIFKSRLSTTNQKEKELVNCRIRDILQGPVMQNDSCLIDIIRSEYLIPPSTEPYKFTQRHKFNKNGRDAKREAIEKYTNTTNKNGFFIECGANDGEFLSNTLQVEVEYGWKGLLIEANTDVFGKLKTKSRKSWLINACLSPMPYTTQLTFYKNPENSGVSGLNHRIAFGATVGEVVQCFPLYSILSALNVSVVDYFSLDIEGKELDILQTIPFDKVTFKVLTVEHWSVPGGRAAVQSFLETKGYSFIEEINDSLTRDAVYIHNSRVIKSAVNLGVGLKQIMTPRVKPYNWF